MAEELDDADRARLERIARRASADLDYANRAGFGDPIKELMAAQYERVTGRLGYEPGPVEES